MRVEIFYPPEGVFCLFEPAFNVPYQRVQTLDAPTATIQGALDWTWRYANIVDAGDPWVQTGLRSAMVGDVFLVNGEAHAVMILGFEQFAFEQVDDTLILQGTLRRAPLAIIPNPRGTQKE